MTIEDVYEPYLMQIGFINRTPRGRVVLPAAYAHLGLSAPGQGLPRADEPAGVTVCRAAFYAVRGIV